MTRVNEMNCYVEELWNVRNNVSEKVRTVIYCLIKHVKRLSTKTLETNKHHAERIIILTERNDYLLEPLTPCEVVAREMAEKILRMN